MLNVYNVLNVVLWYLFRSAQPPPEIGGTSNLETEKFRLMKGVRDVVEEESQDLVSDLSDLKLTFFCSFCLLLGRNCNSPPFIEFSVPAAWVNIQ